jgi:hypothetical protein
MASFPFPSPLFQVYFGCGLGFSGHADVYDSHGWIPHHEQHAYMQNYYMLPRILQVWDEPWEKSLSDRDHMRAQHLRILMLINVYREV